MDWVREVRELHEFFETWFNGGDVSIERMEQALAPGFTIVGPDGSVSDRASSIAAVAAGRGQATGLSIRTHDEELLAQTESMIVGRYVETHEFGDRSTHRWSTVVFHVDPDGPNGVRWVTVHETWRPDDA